MALTDQITADIKAAMKARNKERLAALRDIKSKLMLEMTKEGGDGNVDDAVGQKILNKLYKQRMDTATIYGEQGREDLQAEELAQAEIIKEYLPEQMSDADLEAAVQGFITDLGASSMADMGKVMGKASGALAGKADGKRISEVVKRILGN
ncbi:MAG: GatB/YqeY domain-containing protein [Flavobacteriales bacterium]